ncbi:MAG: hypothetical protein ABFD91_11585 [Anaerohalosphaeraceae bacterium]
MRILKIIAIKVFLLLIVIFILALFSKSIQKVIYEISQGSVEYYDFGDNYVMVRPFGNLSEWNILDDTYLRIVEGPITEIVVDHSWIAGKNINGYFLIDKRDHKITLGISKKEQLDEIVNYNLSKMNWLKEKKQIEKYRIIYPETTRDINIIKFTFDILACIVCIMILIGFQNTRKIIKWLWKVLSTS